MLKKNLLFFQNWSYLGWSDIQARYRRSSLGVFWITLSTLISSAAIAYVYSGIFKVSFAEYLPYITLGICFWNFTSISINELTTSLTQNRQLLLGRKIDPFWIWYRLIVRNVIVLAHSLLVVLPILIYLDGKLTLVGVLYCLLAIVLVSIILLSFGGVLSVLSVRFGDIPQAVAAIVGLAFLITPVLWNTKVLGDRNNYLVDWNPFYHIVTAMRSPLLGEQVNASTWLVLLGAAVLGLFATVIVASRFRKSSMPWL